MVRHAVRVVRVVARAVGRLLWDVVLLMLLGMGTSAVLVIIESVTAIEESSGFLFVVHSVEGTLPVASVVIAVIVVVVLMLGVLVVDYL